MQETLTDASTHLLFFTLELNRLDDAKMEAALDVPAFGKYRPWIEDVRAEHHERFDGTGYPKGLQGKKLSAEAQIIGLAGYIDKWCSVKPGQARKEPLEELERFQREFATDPAKSEFDPNLVLKVLSLFKGTSDKSSSGAA